MNNVYKHNVLWFAGRVRYRCSYMHGFFSIFKTWIVYCIRVLEVLEGTLCWCQPSQTHFRWACLGLGIKAHFLWSLDWGVSYIGPQAGNIWTDLYLSLFILSSNILLYINIIFLFFSYILMILGCNLDCIQVLK